MSAAYDLSPIAPISTLRNASRRNGAGLDSASAAGGLDEPVAVAGHPFRELDDIVLDLKGLVAVRDLRRAAGAAIDELEMYGAQIERTRERLGRFAREASLPQLA